MFSLEGLAQGTGTMEPHSLTWIFVLAMCFSFLDAFGIGSNDVANSFATSVGSRVLTLKKACLIALFTEFLGAVMLGANVTSTIRNGIIDSSLFDQRPDMMMFGFMCAMIGSSLWVLLASRLGMPVSTTHAIVGGVMGMGLVCFGPDAINWSWSGVGMILASFVISPVFAGVVAAALFMTTKYLVLAHENSFKRALYLTPVYTAVTIGAVMAFWVYKGTPALGLDKKPLWMQLTIILVPTAVVTLFSAVFLVPYMNKRAKQEEIQGNVGAAPDVEVPAVDLDGAEVQPQVYYTDVAATADNSAKSDKTAAAAAAVSALSNLELAATDSTSTDGSDTAAPAAVPTFSDDKKGWAMYWLNRTVLRGVNQEVVDYGVKKNQEMHAAAVKYENKTERVFSWLQIITAAMASFAHGANDVSNAIGPLSAVFYIWQTGTVPGAKSPVPTWILVWGGVGIQLGLLLYGYRMMRNLGNNLTHMSPTRGFTMELGAIVTVLLATGLGLPVSTTHCITGATVAVGLCNGNVKAVNWKMVAWMAFGWILTIPLAGLVAGLATAFGAAAPNFAPGYPM